MSAPTTTVLHWNLLASYLGHNTMPWFLHGLRLPAVRRQRIMEAYSALDPVTHLPLNPHPQFLDGLLSADERAIVDDVDRRYFAWPKRLDRITSRLMEADADVLSIVELDHFDELKARMDSKYDGVFFKRPRLVSPDGSSLFWRKDRFKLMRHNAIAFVDRYDPDAVLDRCAVVALLERTASPKDRTLFVSVHLAREKTGQEQGQLRARQLSLLAQSLRQCCIQWGESLEETPVVVCGDVNESKLSRLQGMVAVGAILAGTPLHPFAFASRAVLLNAPTSVTEARAVTVDAVLYSQPRLTVDVISGPRISAGVIPDEFTPSDHHPILVSVSVKSLEVRRRESVARWLNCIQGSSHGNDEGEDVFLGPSELTLAFETLDLDKDGQVSQAEAASVIKWLSLPSAPQDLFPLQYADFCALFYSSRPFSSLLSRAAFDSMDSSPRDGLLSATELRLFFQAFDKSPLEVQNHQCERLLADAKRRGLTRGDGLDLDGFQIFLGTKFCELVFPPKVAEQIVTSMLQRAAAATVKK